MGEQKPAFGVTPAHLSLDAGAPIGRKIELWLVVELEFVTFERAPHLPLELVVALHLGIEIQVVEPDLAAALLLRPIEGAISIRDQLVGIVAALRKERHTNAGPDLNFAAADAEWLGHELDEPLSKIRRPRRAWHIEGNYAKLVAAKRAKVSLSRVAGRSRLTTIRSS